MTNVIEEQQQQQITSSYSALTTHRRCPQQYFYRYDLGLRRAEGDASPELELGSWWSVIRAAEAAERGRELQTLVQDFSTELRLPDDSVMTVGSITVDKVQGSLVTWWSGRKTQPVSETETVKDAWVEKFGGEAPEILSGMLARHLERWADEIAKEQPLGVEVYWEKDLPVPKNDTWAGEYPAMKLKGYIDEVYFDTERQLVVVRDHKTAKQLDAATTLDDMMDSQLHLYAWGVNDIVRQWTDGKSVGAVAYDRARSVAPRPPQLTKSGKLRVFRGEPSVSMTDLKTYLDWVATEPEFEGMKKDGSGAGVYVAEEKVIEQLQSSSAQSRWFTRTLTPLNRNLIQTHLRAAVDSSADAQRTLDRSEQTREAQRNLSRFCGWCDFSTLCRAQMFGGPKGEYDLQEHNLTTKTGLTLLSGGKVVELTSSKSTNEFDL